ncbi:MAG: ShlB/FhaC/HecB family hemolysin secretion/activation protein [Leptothrix sp. (in: b-proteobacteria)]
MNKQMLKPSALAVAISLALAATAAAAQTVPNIGDALHQVQPPEVPAPRTPAVPQIGGAQQPIEPPMTALPGGPKVEVKAIEVIGNRVIDTASLAALVADGAGQALTLADLEGLAQRITKHYRASGYFVARAYIPAQDVTTGTVKIRVVEGNYGRFHLKNKSLVRDEIVQGMLDDIKDRDIVSLDTLERAMLIINDTPGVQVTRADVMPGEQVGTSDFAVDTVATAARNGYVMLDNYGSVYTGKNRLSFNVDSNSPTGSGDRLSVSGLGTSGANLLNGRLGYSTSLAPNGLRGEMALSQTNYQLGSTYAALDAVGTAKSIDAALTYPVRRIRAQTVEASFALGYKDLRDEIRSAGTSTPKTLASAAAGLSVRDEGTLLGFDGLTQAGATLTFGSLDIKDSAAKALDAAGPQTNGQYGKLALNLSRTSLLPDSFTLNTAIKGQYALNNKTLDGSERMTVSGSGAVMAYPSGELIGDKALFVHAELSRPLPAQGDLQSSWALFANYGEARSWQAGSGHSQRHIADAGIGLNASYHGLLLRAHLARRMDPASPLSEPESRNKLLLQAGWTF